MSAPRGPILVAGVDRSGIGLMGELLDAHPEIFVSRRTNLWSHYHRRFGDLRRPRNLERCLAAMLASPRIRALQPDRDQLRAALGPAPTYGRLFAALHEPHLRRLGKSRWGDKSLASEGHAEAMLRTYPDACVVHVVRDPRDRYASQATHRRASRGQVGAGVALWSWSLRQARRNHARHPGRYLVVRYEDLVTAPEATLRRVCDLVGEPYAPKMLEAGPDGGARVLTAASIGRFRRDLTPREVAFVDLVARRGMRALGYAPAGVALPWPDRIAFVAVDLPRNLARMAAWALRWSWSRRRAPWPGAGRVAARGAGRGRAQGSATAAGGGAAPGGRDGAQAPRAPQAK